ncbi:uncharacterized protein LOC124532024 [Vanessa cardui]|uniref:uncharacterized protein LOC124532024 n=1 Tax=Vanessa cardui TaxID=171605 RepID=UPI001F143217|nr:uncharacterized protein LOC124532024 [Vanessa cardui]
MNYSREEGRQARRPILRSSDDVERMAIESSRARLMMQLLRKPDESSTEIGSYLRGKSNESARSAVRKQNFLAYPSIVQGLHWSPSVENYSGDSQTETAENLLNCNCYKCQLNRRHDWEHPMNINNYSFKENIVRFCDTSTMTRVLKDSGCGVSTPLSSTANTSDVSISTSDTTDVVKVLRPQAYTPAPILKKTEFGKEINHRVSINLEDTGRKRSDYEDLLNTLTKEPVTIIPFNSNSKGDLQNSRKVLYNEGISNLIANKTLPNFPFHATQIKSQMKLESSNRPVASKKRFGRKSTVIPYTHRTNSKYHYDCKDTNHLYKGNVEDHLIGSPIVVSLKKTMKNDRTHFVKLPRRVLTSA